MGNIALVMGGVRSGKSRFAQELARELGSDDVVYLATAEARDDEMKRRIDLHQTSRPATWRTLEATQQVAQVIRERENNGSVLLVDCLTILVSNVLLSCCEPLDAAQAEWKVNAEIAELIDACAQRPGPAILVSGEVGMGVVPEYALGRLYRDLLGWTNQTVASRASAAYLLVAGLPIEMKTLASCVSIAAQDLRTP